MNTQIYYIRIMIRIASWRNDLDQDHNNYKIPIAGCGPQLVSACMRSRISIVAKLVNVSETP